MPSTSAHSSARISPTAAPDYAAQDPDPLKEEEEDLFSYRHLDQSMKMRAVSTEYKGATPHLRVFVNKHRERLLQELHNRTQKEHLLQEEKRR